MDVPDIYLYVSLQYACPCIHTLSQTTLLRLEYEQCLRAVNTLNTKDSEIAHLIENLQDVLQGAGATTSSVNTGKEVKEGRGGNGQVDADGEGGRTDSRASGNGSSNSVAILPHLPPPGTILAQDKVLQQLQRRIDLLSKACMQVGKEMSRQTVATTQSHETEAELVESVEERRRMLLHVLDECKVLYFGGGGRQQQQQQDQQQQKQRQTVALQRENVSSAGSDAPAPGGGAAAAEGADLHSTRSSCPSSAPAGLPRRSRDIVQLRMKYEQEFMHLMEDERYREGRLLTRWLALLHEVAAATATAAEEEREMDVVRMSSSNRRSSGGSHQQRHYHHRSSSMEVC